VLWEYTYISAIDFHYSLRNTSRLGRLDRSADKVSHSMSCDIDSPSREVIKKIKISRRKASDTLAGEPGGLDSFQVSVYLISLDI
jgi:ribosomal protein S14